MKSFSVILFFFAMVFTVAAQTNADAGPVLALSLQDCIESALGHNLDLQIDRINPQISRLELNADYGGYDPTFNLSGQHEHNESGAEGTFPTTSDENIFNSSFSGVAPWGMTYGLSGNAQKANAPVVPTGSTNSVFASSVSSVQLSVTQPLLRNFWIDNTRLTIRVAKNRLKFSEQGLRQQLITTVTAVEDAYYELIYAQDFVQVQQEALDLAQTQLDQDKQRVQIGTLAQLSVQSDQSQVATSQANLIAAQNTLSQDQNALKNLLTDDYAGWQGTNIQPIAKLEAPPESFDLQDSWSKGLTKRPDLLQVRLNVEEQGIELKYSFNQLFPELDLIGTYGYNGAGQSYNDTFNQINSGDRPFYSYGAQISVPLSNTGPRNQYKSAKATLQQVVLQLKQFEQNVMVQIDNAVKQAQSTYQSVDATRQARIYSEAALNAEQTTYGVGKATTFDVLQYQNNLTNARAQEIRALADYEEALANLAAQEGTTLERNNINIEGGQ